MEKTAHPTYAHCPIRHIVDRFGDKWSLLVLYNLHTSGCLRFSEIHRRTADISQKMLASTLRRLEQDGLLSRTVYPEVPPRVEYALTPRGESLMPHLVSLIGWALENFGGNGNVRIVLQRGEGWYALNYNTRNTNCIVWHLNTADDTDTEIGRASCRERVSSPV